MALTADAMEVFTYIPPKASPAGSVRQSTVSASVRTTAKVCSGLWLGRFRMRSASSITTIAATIPNSACIDKNPFMI